MGSSGEAERACRGDWVQVHVVILAPEERPQTLPEATRAVPYEGWIKGFLREDAAALGDTVRIETLIGREVTGALTAINPRYDHGFGEPQRTLVTIGAEAWRRLEGKE